MRMLRLALLTAVATGLLAVPALAADPTYVDEVIKVPTKYGRVWAEVHRPDGVGKVPIILTYSPYNTINENGGDNAADPGGGPCRAQGGARPGGGGVRPRHPPR